VFPFTQYPFGAVAGLPELGAVHPVGVTVPVEEELPESQAVTPTATSEAVSDNAK
jgi:hypothetical protein